MSLTIQQWKDTGLIPSVGLQTWHEADGITGLNNGDAISSVPDFSGNSRTLACSSSKPIFTTNVLNGKPAIVFDGTNNPLVYVGSTFVGKHVFILAAYDDANFAGNYMGLLSSNGGGVSDMAILGNPSGTRFTDAFGLSGISYRKQNVSHAYNDMQAPMSGNISIVEMSSSPSVSYNGGISLGAWWFDPSAKWKGPVLLCMIWNRELTDAERMRVLFYFNLKYAQYKAGIPLYFPSDDFIGIRRRRFYAESPMYSKITDSIEFEDGGKTFNEVADNAPRRWEYNYKLVNTSGSTDPAAVRLFDEFYDLVRLSKPFYFTDKYGTVWDNVRVESYDRDHDAHKSWKQEIKFRLIRYPN